TGESLIYGVLVPQGRDAAPPSRRARRGVKGGSSGVPRDLDLDGVGILPDESLDHGGHAIVGGELVRAGELVFQRPVPIDLNRPVPPAGRVLLAPPRVPATA